WHFLLLLCSYYLLQVLPQRREDTNFYFWDGFFSFIPDLPLENLCPSPDSSGNPFVFFFQKQKIATDSGNSSSLILITEKLLPKEYYIVLLLLYR
ncbi:hypothetical protein, partial [Flavobacterium sp. ANB]|uniref:hypothetical protein n=1 Tax=Flavobacterium sp. ANB TaxID=2783790 RepID=UPI001E289BCA